MVDSWQGGEGGRGGESKEREAPGPWGVRSLLARCRALPVRLAGASETACHQTIGQTWPDDDDYLSVDAGQAI